MGKFVDLSSTNLSSTIWAQFELNNKLATKNAVSKRYVFLKFSVVSFQITLVELMH